MPFVWRPGVRIVWFEAPVTVPRFQELIELIAGRSMFCAPSIAPGAKLAMSMPLVGATPVSQFAPSVSV